MYLDSITKKFDLEVFCDITFEFIEGRRYAIFGKNGSGKTTLLNIMNGNILPDSGKLDFGKYNIMFIRNNSIPFPFMSAMDFIVQSCELKNVVYDKIKILKLIDEFGLSEREEELLVTYSKGMQYKVLLIIALLSNVDILLLDEPFSELDMLTLNKLDNLFKTYMQSATLIFTSHSIEIANKVADEILILSKNELKTIAHKEESGNFGIVEIELIREMEEK